MGAFIRIDVLWVARHTHHNVLYACFFDGDLPQLLQGISQQHWDFTCEVLSYKTDIDCCYFGPVHEHCQHPGCSFLEGSLSQPLQGIGRQKCGLSKCDVVKLMVKITRMRCKVLLSIELFCANG